MKFTEQIFEKCGGRCCVCNHALLVCATGCQNAFEPSSKEELIKRVDNNEFPFHDAFIVDYLFGKYGYRYGRDN